MGPEGSLGVRDDLFSEYALDHCYDEMFDRAGVPREPYAALHRRLLELSPAELRHRQPPTRGVFRGEAGSVLAVQVTVSLADAPIRPERVMPMSTWVAPEVVEPPDAFDQAQQQQRSNNRVRRVQRVR